MVVNFFSEHFVEGNETYEGWFAWDFDQPSNKKTMPCGEKWVRFLDATQMTCFGLKMKYLTGSDRISVFVSTLMRCLNRYFFRHNIE